MDDIKSKSQQKREEIMAEAKKPTHRLFCEACTGVAALMVEGEEMPKSVNCRACGKPQVVKKQNLIKL